MVLNNLEFFAEALSVVPAIHTNGHDLVVATVGPYAIPTAKLMLRYPETTQAICLDTDNAPLPADRRATMGTWPLRPESVDIASVAVMGDPLPALKRLRGGLKPGAVVSVAVDQFSRGRAVKEGLQALFQTVVPYREHLPNCALFFLVANRELSRPRRPFPQGLRRLTPRYLTNLFTLAKDEYLALYGPLESAPERGTIKPAT